MSAADDDVVSLAARPRSQRYALLQNVTHGGNGSIWLGIDRITNGRVAIKKQDLTSEASARELTALSALGAFPHVHVIMMKDYYASGSFLYTVYEALPTTLWHIWKSHDCQFQQIGMEVVCKYMAGVAHGINHMHDHNIVHGDATLANMLVDDAGVVKVADFGSAHSCQGFLLGDSRQVTTPYVRAPEKLLGYVSSSTSIDTWAVGVQALALFTGQIPWIECSDPASIFDKIMTTLLGPISTSWPGHEDLPFWKQVKAKHDACQEKSLLQDVWNVEGRIAALHTRPPTDSVDIVPALVAMLQWNPANRPSLRHMLTYQFFLEGSISALSPCSGEEMSKRRRLHEEQGGSLGLGPPGLGPPGLEPTGLEPTGVGPPGLEPTGVESKSDRSPTGLSEKSIGLRPTAPVSAQNSSKIPATILPRCQCSGNCGWKVCSSRQNRKVRKCLLEGESICRNLPIRGCKYCMWCKCECEQCVSPRNKREGGGRWCKGCGPPILQQMSTKVWVKSSSGTVMPLNPRSSIQLKLVLRLMWCLRTLLPSDLAACLQVVAFYKPRQGTPVSVHCVVATFVAQTIKWPPAVHYFLYSLQRADWPDGDAHAMAETMMEIYLCVIKWCDGKVWSDMFDRMHGKGKKNRLDAATGLNNAATCMGILQKSDTGVRLGRGQQSYEFTEDSAAVGRQFFKYMFERAAELQVAWPSSADDTPKFGDELLAFARAVRSFKVNGKGLPGGQDEAFLYNAKSFTRIMLLHAQELCPTLLDKLVLKDMLKWIPDERSRLTAFENMTGHQIREAFDTDPMMLSCWLCMVHMCSDDKTVSSALKLEYTQFFNVVDAYRKQLETEDDFIFAPGPHVIVEEALAAQV